MTPLYAEFAHARKAAWIEILLVESSPEKAGETIRAIQQCPDLCRVSLVKDGAEAIQFLRHSGVYARTPRPDMILLDFHLARGDGPELLAALRADEQLKSIPLVFLAHGKEPGKRMAEPKTSCLPAAWPLRAGETWQEFTRPLAKESGDVDIEPKEWPAGDDRPAY